MKAGPLAHPAAEPEGNEGGWYGCYVRCAGHQLKVRIAEVAPALGMRCRWGVGGRWAGWPEVAWQAQGMAAAGAAAAARTKLLAASAASAASPHRVCGRLKVGEEVGAEGLQQGLGFVHFVLTGSFLSMQAESRLPFPVPSCPSLRR